MTVPQADSCRHGRVDVIKKIDFLADTGRWILELKLRCLDCKTPFIFQGLPKGFYLDGAATDLTGTVVKLSMLPEGQPAAPGSNVRFDIKPPQDIP